MFLKILEKIKEYQTIIIHRHERPDGDCIGCQMGLKALLKANFPTKEILAVGDEIPTYISYYGENDVVKDEKYQHALAIVVDTSMKKRICDKRYEQAEYIIKIDHHDDSEDFGNLAYVDPVSPACASIIVDMILEWQKNEKIIMTTEAATALALGMITDTGRFRYRGTSSKTLMNAGFLLQYQVNLEDLYTSLYIKDREELKLHGYVCENFLMTPNGVAYIYFDKKTMEKYQVTKETAAACVGLLDSIRDSLIWVVFVEQMKPKDETVQGIEQPDQEVRVRIRSRYVAINEVATHFRGGGHLQAAGATIYSSSEMNTLLSELDLLLKNYKQNNPDKY